MASLRLRVSKLTGDSRYGSVSFGGQHDARLVGNTLTLFDNGSLRGRAPRALRFQLDLVARTATLVNEIENPAVSFSGCCGSARLLPGGHWVVSWGGRSAISEQTESRSADLRTESRLRRIQLPRRPHPPRTAGPCRAACGHGRHAPAVAGDRARRSRIYAVVRRRWRVRRATMRPVSLSRRPRCCSGRWWAHRRPSRARGHVSGSDGLVAARQCRGDIGGALQLQAACRADEGCCGGDAVLFRPSSRSPLERRSRSCPTRQRPHPHRDRELKVPFDTAAARSPSMQAAASVGRRPRPAHAPRDHVVPRRRPRRHDGVEWEGPYVELVPVPMPCNCCAPPQEAGRPQAARHTALSGAQGQSV